MSEIADTLKPLLDRMVEAKQLSAIDADAITRQARDARPGAASSKSEDDILQWLATEYAVAYTALDDVELESLATGRLESRRYGTRVAVKAPMASSPAKPER